MSEKNTSIYAKSMVGILSQLATWPLEYYKILKQLPNKNIRVIDLLKLDIKKNGYINIYRSIIPQLASSGPRSIVRFTVYEKLKNGKLGDKDNSSNLRKFTNAFIAGGVEAITVMTPAEILKVRMIDNKYTVTQSIKSIYHDHGVRGYWRGGSSTFMRQATTQGISLFVFEKINPNVQEKVGKFYGGLVTGIIGGVIAVYINNPVDVVKTLQQSTKLSIVDIIKNVYKKEGVIGFYNGAFLRASRVAPLHGITYFVYERLK